MWEQIRSNQIRSAFLTSFLGVLLLAVGYFIGLYFFGSGTAGLVIAAIVWGVLALLAYTQADDIFLAINRAKKISREDHPRLYNIVEEMKIASGLEKMPDIYIIDDPALNAFATGKSPRKAAVAITSGLLQKLNRDELQSVIGHEISHINNRDVRLMAVAGIMLGAIVILAWYASRALFYGGMAGGGRRRSGSGGGGGAQLIILAVGLVLMILAPIAAQLIYFAISRKREYLADASSALYTRYPEGLASALEKLAMSDTHVQTANQATAPMFTVNPFQKKAASLNELTSTHPPIAERIRILRSMAGASLYEYEQAYRKVKGKSVLSARTLTGAAPAGIRPASAETAPIESPTQKIERARETSDLMWRLSDYKMIDCPCGTKLKIPPAFRGAEVRCPHCGRVHKA